MFKFDSRPERSTYAAAPRSRRHFTLSILRSARPNRKISTPEISFWMALAVDTALGTMGTGF